jgi:hypothetical protein
MRTRIIIFVLLGLATFASRVQAQSAGQSPFAELHNRLARAADAQLEAVRAAPTSQNSTLPAIAPTETGASVDLASGSRSLALVVSLSRVHAAQARLLDLRVDAARIFVEEGVPLELLVVAGVESGFNPQAVSPKGARGAWQLMPATAERFGLRVDGLVDERTHPQRSTRVAARYLRELYEQFGDWLLALAAYNAGEGRVAKAVERGGTRDFWQLAQQRLLPEETRRYVPAVLRSEIPR